MGHRHLVIGATGVAGGGIVRALAGRGEPVFALSRGGDVEADASANVHGVACDLRDHGALQTALASTAPTRVYYAAHVHSKAAAGDLHPRTMQRLIGLAARAAPLCDALPGLRTRYYDAISARAGLHDDGANARLADAVLAGLASDAGASVEHVAVLTGGRLYGVHLGSPLYPAFPAVLREDSPRHPGHSCYFTLEDAFWRAAERAPWSLSLHRPHFILNASRRAPYSLVNAIGVYAALLAEIGSPLIFPGGRRVYEARFEAASAELIGEQMAWAGDTEAAHGRAFNTSNGGPLWWRELWPAIAARFGLAPVVPERALHLHELVPDPAATWAALRRRHGLAPMALEDAFPQAFLHQSMVMTWDVHYDISACRAAGFGAARDQVTECLALLDRLGALGVLPPARGGAGEVR